MDKPIMHRPISEIQAELDAAFEAARAELAARREAVQPRYLFTLMPSNDKYDTIFDPTCKLYKLTGTVLNAKELTDVGKVPFQGSMNYVWNGATNHFVMAVSGGSIFVKTQAVWDELSTFIISNPQGGDVTEIVNRHRS